MNEYVNPAEYRPPFTEWLTGPALRELTLRPAWKNEATAKLDKHWSEAHPRLAQLRKATRWATLAAGVSVAGFGVWQLNETHKGAAKRERTEICAAVGSCTRTGSVVATQAEQQQCMAACEQRLAERERQR